MSTVVVTGAGGSIGSEICRALSKTVSVIRAIGHSELPLWTLERTLRGSSAALELYLGSVNNRELMARACRGADAVIHAAAHKHVPLCEQHPCEAIVNNVGGSLIVADAAARAGAFLVQVSTDKAVRPTSVMGKTKRVAELYVMYGWRFGRAAAIVRFGNVIGSSGSVYQVWDKQIAAGGPITVTDRRCTRYMMSIPEAAGLAVMVAGWRRQGLYVFDMGAPVSIWDLAQQRAQEAAINGNPVAVVETGIRPGEKLTEELTLGGPTRPTEHERIMEVLEDEPQDCAPYDMLASARLGLSDIALPRLDELARC